MSSLYLAGPIRGIPADNAPAFAAAATHGRSLGWTVINPLEMDRFDGIANGDGADYGPAQARVYAARDTATIMSLRGEDGDAIAVLPGWERSTGARAELALARWCQLRVLDARTFEPLAEGGAA